MQKKLPDNPGVYFFLNKKKQILYIGKATSLRNRVRSYFSSDILEKRGPLIQKMMGEKLNIKFIETDSVLEALLLEAELIRKHLPHYNTMGKDQRSFNYVVITKEEFPRVLIVRGRELASPQPLSQGEGENPPFGGGQGGAIFGPFPSSTELKQALKIIRKIFPFRDRCIPSPYHGEGGVGCFNYQLGLCPGVCVGAISKQDYAKTIRNIKLFFQGKKKILIRKLKSEMRGLAKFRKFEEAEKIKHQIFALQHINDIALVREKYLGADRKAQGFRIEAYDISHISGTNMVGVMTVVENGEMKKSDYRMFKIRGQSGADDTKALGEVLERRLKHTEWPMPDLIVVDGGQAQVNKAKEILKDGKMERIKIVGVVKDEKHKPKEILGKFDKNLEKSILLANSESHRFALAFHRRRRKI